MILSSRKKLLDIIPFSVLVNQTMTLLHYMKEHKVEIRELAEKAKVTEAYISAIRHGHRRPSPDVAKRISEACGIPILDLLYPDSLISRVEPEQSRRDIKAIRFNAIEIRAVEEKIPETSKRRKSK